MCRSSCTSLEALSLAVSRRRVPADPGAPGCGIILGHLIVRSDRRSHSHNGLSRPPSIVVSRRKLCRFRVISSLSYVKFRCFRDADSVVLGTTNLLPKHLK